jgi:hypothetical protein
MGILDKFALNGAITKLKSSAKNAGDSTNPYIVYEEKDVQQFLDSVTTYINQPKPKRNQLSAAEMELRRDIIPLKIAESKERALHELNLLVEKIFSEGEKKHE